MGHFFETLRTASPAASVIISMEFMLSFGFLTTRLTKLLRHLNSHCDEEIDWEQLATRFEIPLRTLSRKITDLTGMSPNAYLLRLRLCRAMRMLKETDKTVTEIAFACGFNDSNYFTSRFHREIGMTPLKYRRHGDAAAAGELER